MDVVHPGFYFIAVTVVLAEVYSRQCGGGRSDIALFLDSGVVLEQEIAFAGSAFWARPAVGQIMEGHAADLVIKSELADLTIVDRHYFLSLQM